MITPRAPEQMTRTAAGTARGRTPDAQDQQPDDEHDQVEDQARPVHDRFFPQAQDRLDDQDADADTDACEGVLDDGIVGKALQEGGDQQDDDDGDRDKTDGR